MRIVFKAGFLASFLDSSLAAAYVVLLPDVIIDRVLMTTIERC